MGLRSAMKCPACGSKEMALGDWVRMTKQMSRMISSPWSGAKMLRMFMADETAHMYKCAHCSQRFARCDGCHKKWPITSRTEAGDTTDCPKCFETVVYVGRHF